MTRSTRHHHSPEVIKVADSDGLANVPTGSAFRPDLEPLAAYLEPQFGNIYEYNLQSADDVGFNIQPWMPELQTAVTHYLVHEVIAEDWQPFLDELDCDVPDGTRDEQAAFIIAHDEPWVVAYASHLAVLNAVPALGQLIGQLETWPDAGLQEDVSVWLNTHTSHEQLAELAAITNHPERNAASPQYNPDPTGWDLAENLMPPTILDAWHHVVGPAESDLTDDEWRLLMPFVESKKTRFGTALRLEKELVELRHALDGLRFKFAHDVPWSKIPERYGDGRNLYQRYLNYRRTEVFSRMLGALQGKPEAVGLVAWLEEIVDSGHQEGDSADQAREEGV